MFKEILMFCGLVLFNITCMIVIKAFVQWEFIPLNEWYEVTRMFFLLVLLVLTAFPCVAYAVSKEAS